MTDADRGFLRTIQTGGEYSKADLHRMGLKKDSQCDYCGYHTCCVDHILWQCEHFQQVRMGVDEQAACIPMKMLSLPLRRGIAPALSAQHQCTYWGLDISKIDVDVPVNVAKLLGVFSHDLPQKCRDELDKAFCRGLNTRQIVAEMRGAFASGVDPEFPEEVEGCPPDDINAYSDGGLKSPGDHKWALGGVGIWWPGIRTREEFDELMPSKPIAHQEGNQDGYGQWNRMSGQKGSSTRMELAALIVAMTRNTPLHMGIDSQSTIAKARRLQAIATARCESRSASWWMWKNPYKRPWALQTDGDLWQQYWGGLMTRGPGTITYTKVKGHASDQHIASGEATQSQKEGNDYADHYAGKGKLEHGAVAVQIAEWGAQRQAGYVLLMEKLQKIIVAVLQAEKQERERREKAAIILKGFDEHKHTRIDGVLPVCQDAPLVQLQLSTPTRGVHKYRGQQKLYESIHDFLAQAQWHDVSQMDGVAGSTWVELFAAFDTGHHRQLGAHFVKNPHEEERARARAVAVGKPDRCRRPGSIKRSRFCISRPMMRAELDNFKCIVRYTLRNECEPAQFHLFKPTSCIADRRLRNLGITGCHPAVNVQLVQNLSTSINTARAIAMQRIGASINQSMLDLAEGKIEAAMVKWVQLDTASSVKWQRTYKHFSSMDGAVEGDLCTVDVPMYAQRLLECGVCGQLRETRHIQLRTKQGYRAVHCFRCHAQRWCGRLKCQCGTWWHQCPVHKVDPVEHTVLRKHSDKRPLELSQTLPAERGAPECGTGHHRALKRRRVEHSGEHQPRISLSRITCPKLAARFPHLLREC